MQKAQSETFDMLILDIMLPEVDGLEICRTVRVGNSQIPILMLTAKSSELDRVLGLEMGADDYMSKPFSTLELTARVKALLRRASISDTKETTQKIIQFKALEIDTDNRRLFIDSKEVELTPKEFDLLHHFVTNPGRVFSRMQLLDKVWGYSYEGYHHTVNSHINRLRTKIENDPHEPEYILTRWGVGYEFCKAG